jgi:hypothetical protein
MTEVRRTRGKPQQHSDRLLRILQANLESARDPDPRERLARAIERLRQKREVA